VHRSRMTSARDFVRRPPFVPFSVCCEETARAPYG
jgi:hypothetical protein